MGCVSARRRQIGVGFTTDKGGQWGAASSAAASVSCFNV